MYNRGNLMNRIAYIIANVLGSRQFFWGVMAFFVFECLWVALSSAYPMAFDEEYHFGIINIYADHFVPFLAAQPPDANQFGAVARDPSFLYHWLMSFPYRAVAAVTDSQMVQVLVLRTINIAIVSVSLLLYARALGRTGVSRAFMHTAFALFVLIPILPQLAGQINYDGLLMLWTAILCLLTFSVIEQIRSGKVAASTVGLFVAVCMLGVLTKYAFLPIAVAAVLVVIVYGCRLRHMLRSATKHFIDSFTGMHHGARIGLVALLLLSSILFVQRYGINIVQYRTPVPDCSAVLSIDACKEYGPWGRNYRMASEKTSVDANPFAYTVRWVQGLHYRLFFSVNGPHHGYASYPPTPLPSATFVAVTITGLVALCLYGRRVFRGSPYMLIALLLSIAYITVLWINNYTDYLQTGHPVAVNGRYLLPVLLLIAATWGKAIGTALRPWPPLKSLAAAVVLLLFINGGGVSSFIMRTDSTWYWPDAPIITVVNEAARSVLEPITLEGPKRY